MALRTVARLSIRAALPLVLLAAGACATIISGKTQNVGFTSTPAGAQLMIDDAVQGSTPVTVQLSRKSEHVVRVSMAGYQPYEMQLTKGLNGWFFGNIVFGGLIGIIVDASTGAMYKLSPAEVAAALDVADASAEEVDGTLFVAVVLRADPGLERVGMLSRVGGR